MSLVSRAAFVVSLFNVTVKGSNPMEKHAIEIIHNNNYYYKYLCFRTVLQLSQKLRDLIKKLSL